MGKPRRYSCARILKKVPGRQPGKILGGIDREFIGLIPGGFTEKMLREKISGRIFESVHVEST